MVSKLQKCRKQIKWSLWVFSLWVTHPYCFRRTCGCLIVSGRGGTLIKCWFASDHISIKRIHLCTSLPLWSPPTYFLYISFNFHWKGDDRSSVYVFFSIQIFLCYPAETKPVVEASIFLQAQAHALFQCSNVMLQLDTDMADVEKLFIPPALMQTLRDLY